MTVLSSVSPAALASVIASGDRHKLLDVRAPSEYASVHVPGATLIPLDELNADKFLDRHPAGTPVYVLCHGGTRATRAIDKLERAGCNDCILVEGGTQAWIDAGLSVHRGASKVLPIMRQVQIVAGGLSALGALLALTVNSRFAAVSLLIGSGLLFAGITGACGMALLLARMPWNRAHRGSSHCCCTPESL
jgi:rhodanese-related sulfurtransferase